MIKTKYLNNMLSYGCTDNSFTKKKEEKIYPPISIIEPVFQPIINKSGISNKK